MPTTLPPNHLTTPPLTGLFVIELASVLAGPQVGQFLAELGAEVLKIEAPGAGDVTRSWKAPGEDAGGATSAYFAAANWGKRGLRLDLTTATGRAELLTLATRADIILTSYKPGDAEKLGADYATLSAINPGLLYGSITGYGPANERAGYDAVLQAETGFAYLNAPVDAQTGAPGPPQKMPVALIDLLAAHQLKEGLLVALYRRARTGQGALVEVSLAQAALASLANQATNWLVANHNPQPLGSEHPNIAPYGTTFPTLDGTLVVLAVGTDRQFQHLCQALNCPALTTDARFATNPARVQHRPELNAELAPRLAAIAGNELLEKLHRAHVPAGAVRDVAQALAAPEAAPLLLRHPETGRAGGVRTAVFWLDGAAPNLPLTPPQ